MTTTKVALVMAAKSQRWSHTDRYLICRLQGILPSRSACIPPLPSLCEHLLLGGARTQHRALPFWSAGSACLCLQEAGCVVSKISERLAPQLSSQPQESTLHTQSYFRPLSFGRPDPPAVLRWTKRRRLCWCPYMVLWYLSTS